MSAVDMLDALVPRYFVGRQARFKMAEHVKVANAGLRVQGCLALSNGLLTNDSHEVS